MKMLLPDRPISRNLTGMNMLVCAAALTIACAAFVGYDQLNFRYKMVQELSIQAQIIASDSVTALIFNDPRSAKETLAALEAAPQVMRAGILTTNGQAFATYRRKQTPEQFSLPAITSGQIEAHRFGQGNLVLARTIEFQGQPAGTVYIEADLGEITGRLKQYAGIGFLVLVLSLLAALPVSTLFRRAVAEPIVGLAAIASQISREKDYSLRAPATSRHDELAVLIHSFNEMLAEIQRQEMALRKAHDGLEDRVEERTAELIRANKELEAFSYSVSHDLRSPLRSIDGFSQALLEDCSEVLNEQGKGYLQRIRTASQRMGMLIDDLLNLSRVTRYEIRKERVDASGIAESISRELRRSQPEREAEIVILDTMEVCADARLLRLALENLLGNAWKFTSKRPAARIEFGREQEQSKSRFVYFVRDNGAGFDPAYADRLFGAFQRLHAAADFPGTGIGLATVQRIIHRHGGRIWAQSATNEGATFFFTLGRDDSPEERDGDDEEKEAVAARPLTD